MSKEKQSDFNSNWYELWMQQSKEFFETADKNLKDLFGKGTYPNPEDHLQQIKLWLETLKNQWQFIKLNQQQKTYEEYFKTMGSMCNEATDMLLEQWIKRSRENDPVKNSRDLYELWLNCCNDIYAKSMHSKSYQDAYGEFMNAALNYWKSACRNKG